MAKLYFQKEEIANVTYILLTEDEVNNKYPDTITYSVDDRLIEINMDRVIPFGNVYRLEDGDIKLLINPIVNLGPTKFIATIVNG